MQQSIPRYVGILNEMETHNILETQRLERLEIALRTNQELTSKEKEEIEHLKQDNEELRLTKRKAIYMKKGILVAKARIIELLNENRFNHLMESRFSRIQTLPNSDDDDDIDSLHESVASSASIPNSLVTSSTKNDSKGETSGFAEEPKELRCGTSVSIQNFEEIRGETSNSIEIPKEIKAENSTSIGNSNESKVDLLTFSNNPREHCVSECRVARAFQNDGLPLSVRIPLPVKDNEQCILMGVKDIEKLLEETKSSERSRNDCSLLQMPKCASVSCLFSPSQSPTSSPKSRKSDQSSNSTPHLNQYDLVMNPDQASTIDKTSNSDDKDTKDWKGRKCYKLSAIHQLRNSREINELDSIENLFTIRKVIY